MKSVWKWVILGIAVFLLAFCVALPLWGGFAALPARMADHYGGMGYGMMGWGVAGVGWIGMIFRLAVPVLAIGGVAALAYFLAKRPADPPATPTVPTVACGTCGKPLDPGWVACPYCGKKQK